MRLQEGFHFAHNDSGILNLILELPIKDDNYSKFSSVVQYIIFPPHIINGSKERYVPHNYSVCVCTPFQPIG